MAATFIGITGGQGVGKTTFCSKLLTRLKENTERPVKLLNGLGDAVRSQGIPVGSASTEISIAAIYYQHLLREREQKDGIVLLDRCGVDAAAYAQNLLKDNTHLNNLYQEISKLMTRSLSLVIYLRMDGMFVNSIATHENVQLRTDIDTTIRSILEDWPVDYIGLNSADHGAVERAIEQLKRHL